jgi:integrase
MSPLLLTRARREELAALRRKDVDFQWGSIWLKAPGSESAGGTLVITLPGPSSNLSLPDPFAFSLQALRPG